MERIARMILFVIDYHEENWGKISKFSSQLISNGTHACTDATPRERELVYILLATAWNDAQYWAQAVLAEAKDEAQT